MTEAGHQPGGYPPDELPEFPETAEREFGRVGAQPPWPGVARPAGWFLSAPEEAAPSGLPGTEPARLDNQDPAPATPEYVDLDERPTVTPWQPPVVGPTEALRGRAGGPGFVVPAGLVPGIRDPENRSGWQLAHGLWQESGIDWQESGIDWAETASPLAAPTVFPVLNPVADDATADDAEDELPRRQASPQRPEASDLRPRDAAPEWEGRPLAQRPGELDDEPEEAQSAEQAQSFGQPQEEWDWQEPSASWPGPGGQAGRSWGQPDEAPQPAGQSQDEWEWQETPGPRYSPDQRLARRPWQLDAQEPDARQPSSPWQQADGQPRSRPWQVRDEQQPRAWHPSDERPGEYYGPDQQRYQPRYRLQDQPAPDRPAQGRPAQGRPWQDRPLDVRQPWEDAPQRPARGGRRGRRAWQAARVGVPVVLVLVVGGGALVLLTGKAHEVLYSSGSLGPTSQGPTVATATGKGGTANGSAATADAVFPGYPGLRGSLLVTSIATDGTVQLAAGSADGHAALWRRDGSGTWTLLRKRPSLPQGTILTSIAHGPAGWLAVGNLSTTGEPSTANLASTGQQPVVLTSRDGVTWQSAIGNAAFAGPGFTVNAVAAASIGYVVVGEQVLHGVPVDAMWFSPDLVSWTRGGDTIASTVSSLSSGMSDSKIFAVAATATGFVAVGTHNGCHTAWVTTDGQHWLSYDIPKLTGSDDPLLNHVAVAGNTVVASGDLGIHGGRIPLIVVSTDGGVHWRATAIGNYGAFAGPQGTVTALTSDESGFIAAGLVGPPGGQHAVTWTSPDGVTWSAAMPAAQGAQQITALASAGSPATSIASVTGQSGTTSVEVTAPAT